MLEQSLFAVMGFAPPSPPPPPALKRDSTAGPKLPVGSRAKPDLQILPLDDRRATLSTGEICSTDLCGTTPRLFRHMVMVLMEMMPHIEVAANCCSSDPLCLMMERLNQPS